jgi:hypothetical protein
MKGFVKNISANRIIGHNFLVVGIDIKEPTIMYSNDMKICTFNESQKFSEPLNLYCMPYAHITFNKDIVLLYTFADHKTHREYLERFEGEIYINGQRCEVRNQMLGVRIFPYGV